MAEAAIFICSICGEPSSEICFCCTKDACANHRCDRCKRCSDCCECDVPLSAAEAQVAPEVEQPTPPEVEAAVDVEAELGEPAALPNEPASEPSEEIPPPHPEDPIF
jgi:hypothetical protein